MSKRTLFLIIALFVITAVLLTVAIYKPQSSEKISNITPTPEPLAQTVLSFGDPKIVASSGATLTYSVPVNISTGKNKIIAVQLEMQYDPLLLTKMEVASGSFFLKPSVVLNKIDEKTGRISYALGVNPQEKGLSGNRDLASLKFTVPAKKYEETAIIFLPKTKAAIEGLNESVLKEATLGQFFVGTRPSTSSAKPLQ